MQRAACFMRVRGTCPMLLRRAMFSAAPLQVVQRRWAATQRPSDVSAVELTGEYRHGDHADLPSTDVRMDATEDDVEGEDFDELEAASQELHDLCHAMIAHLRRADPAADKMLFERRVKRAFREPKPEQYRRLLHTHGDRSSYRSNNYRSSKEFKEATDLYLQWGNKVLLLLTKPVLDRLVESAGKGHRDLRSDGVHKYRRPLDRATWRTFPHRWYKHAPFEVQQLRADIPQSAVLNTRFYRDHATLRYLFTLMEPQHAFRAPLEKRMFELTKSYDSVASVKK